MSEQEQQKLNGQEKSTEQEKPSGLVQLLDTWSGRILKWGGALGLLITAGISIQGWLAKNYHPILPVALGLVGTPFLLHFVKMRDSDERLMEKYYSWQLRILIISPIYVVVSLAVMVYYIHIDMFGPAFNWGISAAGTLLIVVMNILTYCVDFTLLHRRHTNELFEIISRHTNELFEIISRNTNEMNKAVLDVSRKGLSDVNEFDRKMGDHICLTMEMVVDLKAKFQEFRQHLDDLDKKEPFRQSDEKPKPKRKTKKSQ